MGVTVDVVPSDICWCSVVLFGYQGDDYNGTDRQLRKCARWRAAQAGGRGTCLAIKEFREWIPRWFSHNFIPSLQVCVCVNGTWFSYASLSALLSSLQSSSHRGHPSHDSVMEVQVLIPQPFMGTIIGTGGAKIKELRAVRKLTRYSSCPFKVARKI